MSKFGEITTEQQIFRAKEARGLALEYLHTGSFDHQRWSIEVTAGLGLSLTRMHVVNPKRAEIFAEKSIGWSTQQLTRLGIK